MRRRFHEGVDRILDTAYLSNHEYVRQFETDFAKWNESRFALGVSNGTTALQTLLEAVDVRGYEVIVPTNTFVATAKAILAAGGIPRLVDIEPQFLSFSWEALVAAITPRTRAVVPVHIAGLISSHMPALQALCSERRLALIEDCAHAHGASRGGVRAGNFGRGGAFSFFLTKIMAMGEGGAVVTGDSELYARCKSLRQFGVEEGNTLLHADGGSNFKLSEFSALLGVLELERVNRRIEKRVQLAAVYQERLKGSAWVTLQADRESFCPHYKQVVLSPVPRARVEEALKAQGIHLTGGVYYQPLHRQPAVREFVGRQKFAVADHIADTHFCPPCYPELSDEDIHRVCDVLFTLGGAHG